MEQLQTRTPCLHTFVPRKEQPTKRERAYISDTCTCMQVIHQESAFDLHPRCIPRSVDSTQASYVTCRKMSPDCNQPLYRSTSRLSIPLSSLKQRCAPVQVLRHFSTFTCVFALTAETSGLFVNLPLLPQRRLDTRPPQHHSLRTFPLQTPYESSQGLATLQSTTKPRRR
ncbi:hypothetical protein K504DRAFT_68453 [Pleomassaria siparia CBS 279.74]|uniref:Uncharacterized protein n=1 Tax=Pleomassaria siparia CBS 279.74 TaxID=1314801 RepID=A0A6G1K219_9PLEO|nr:hypothetical protein K504DRAFT_68453 [Pleomassaria siparia CBS 279.74]